MSVARSRRVRSTPTILMIGVLLIGGGVLTLVAVRDREHTDTRAALDQAPPVVLPATNGETVDLAAYLGESNVLLYFYEHAG